MCRKKIGTFNLNGATYNGQTIRPAYIIIKSKIKIIGANSSVAESAHASLANSENFAHVKSSTEFGPRDSDEFRIVIGKNQSTVEQPKASFTMPTQHNLNFGHTTNNFYGSLNQPNFNNFNKSIPDKGKKTTQSKLFSPGAHKDSKASLLGITTGTEAYKQINMLPE